MTTHPLILLSAVLPESLSLIHISEEVGFVQGTVGIIGLTLGGILGGISVARGGYALGFRTFVMQGGEDSAFSVDVVCHLVRQIKAEFPDCACLLYTSRCV